MPRNYRKFFTVFCRGVEVPRKRYPKISYALKEAQRLAAESGNNYYVMSSVGRFGKEGYQPW